MSRVTLVLVVLFVLSDAARVPPNMAAGFYGQMDQPEPVPCCTPAYYTANGAIQTTYVDSDGLQVELQMVQSAYDSIEKKMGGKIHLGFSNGTEESYSYLYDYENGVVYDVFDVQEGLLCSKSHLTDRFPEECIPEDATYVGTATVGDRLLSAVSWYTNYYDAFFHENVHRVDSVQAGECNLLSVLMNSFDATTGIQTSITEVRVYDFSLGICNENEIFKIPQICEGAQQIAKYDGFQIHRVSPTIAYVHKSE